MNDTGFEFLDHTSDVYVRAYNKTLEGAFEQTAYSLMTTITPNLKVILPIHERSIEIKAEDKESLLFDFLSEFLFIFDVEELIFSSIKIHYIKKVENSFVLKSLLKGEKFSKKKHEIGTEVKAVTYNMMEIREKKEQVEIYIVFDI